MMTFDQSEIENRVEFIARLMTAGWTLGEAVEEWNNVQTDEESGE